MDGKQKLPLYNIQVWVAPHSSEEGDGPVACLLDFFFRFGLGISHGCVATNFNRGGCKDVPKLDKSIGFLLFFFLSIG